VYVSDAAVDKSATENARLSVSIDETDYDIRSETGASVDGDSKDKDTQLAANAADSADTSTAEGSLELIVRASGCCCGMNSPASCVCELGCL